MGRISNDIRVRIVTVALGSYVKDVRNGHRNVSMSKKLQENGYSKSASFKLAKALVAVLIEENYIRVHRDKTVSWVSSKQLLSCADVPRLLQMADEAITTKFRERTAKKAVEEVLVHTENEYQWGEKPLPEMAWTVSFSW